jgi:hypothetical protein
LRLLCGAGAFACQPIFPQLLRLSKGAKSSGQRPGSLSEFSLPGAIQRQLKLLECPIGGFQSFLTMTAKIICGRSQLALGFPQLTDRRMDIRMRFGRYSA